MNASRAVCFWLLLGISVSTFAWQSVLAAEPGDTPEPEASPKWEGKYPELPIQKVTREEFDAGWQIDLSVEDWPLGEVLEKIVKDEKEWQVEIAPNAVLDRKISLDLKNVSRLEAIELACREIGYHPEYGNGHLIDQYDALSKQLRDVPKEKWNEFIAEFHHQTNATPTTLSLRPGKFPLIKGMSPRKEPYPSVAFAGPVRLVVTELNEDAPNATGQLKLKMQWLPLPKSVGPNSNSEAEEMHWRLGAIISPEGDNLLASGYGTSYGDLSRTYILGCEKTYLLKSLLKDVDRIGTLSWQVHFYLPVQWSPMWFKNPKSGDKVTKDGYTATYGGQWFSGSVSGFMFDRGRYARNGNLKQIRIFAFDSEGYPVDPGVSLIDGTKTAGRSLGMRETPALFVIVPITKTIDVAYSHAFEDIPLSKHEQQPEQLTTLDYGDHEAPVSGKNLERVEADTELFETRGGTGLMQMKLTNHSNKPIQEVRVAMYKVDDQGKRIDGSSSFLYFRGGNGFDQVGKLLDPGQSVTAETHHYDVPAKDVKLQTEINRVIFLDKTQWTPKGERPDGLPFPE